jgi:hypothetical protein
MRGVLPIRNGRGGCQRFVSTYDAITFLPCVRDGTGRTGYSFGAHATDGTALEAFSHDWYAFRKPEPAVLHLNGTAIYGGMLMNHFGHFLVEAMARLWFIRERPELPILWHWIDLPVPHTPGRVRFGACWCSTRAAIM